MTTGALKWNFILSGIVSLLTFLFSFLNNLLMGSLIRAFVIFGVFFFVIMVAQLVTRQMLGTALLPQEEGVEPGQHVNLVTPEGTSMSPVEIGKDQQRRAEGDFAGFSPNDFPRVARNESSALDPEEIAQALRVFSDE